MTYVAYVSGLSTNVIRPLSLFIFAKDFPEKLSLRTGGGSQKASEKVKPLQSRNVGL